MVDTNSIIEGTVKFRDGKKWKWRWGVMRKLSPVADCLHLQLYRDSKDRCKLGHTKASLSLQQFLGIETGFTLDKESNTIAILCQDITVILAFDTRERLIQWQVKIANNLGEDQQFLIQISSAPPKSKVPAGPARLHVQELRFCLTSGVPPKLLGCWEIALLRRYGVVDGKFCFEGGSRCGRGEGLHILLSDQAEDIQHTLQLAAQSKLFTRKRPASRNSSMLDSPSRTACPSRARTRMSDISCADSLAARVSLADSLADHHCCCSDDCHPAEEDSQYSCNHRHSPFWPSAESSRATDLDSNYGCGDTTSVREMPGDCTIQHHAHDGDVSRRHAAMERCASCFSKLGAPSMSRSSTCTPGTPMNPVWPQEPGIRTKCSTGTCDRVSMSSHDSVDASEYSVPRLSFPDGSICGPPARPPRPEPDQTSPSKKKRKPPMPLPVQEGDALKDKDYVVHTCACQHPQLCQRFFTGKDLDDSISSVYENYDVPRNITRDLGSCKSPDGQQFLSLSSVSPGEYYDTPKNLKDCVSSPGQYGNYDTPASAKVTCACVLRMKKKASVVVQAPGDSTKTLLEGKDGQVCPCQRVMCWMRLPYCRRGNSVDSSTIHKVKLDGEGKMPVVNSSGEIAIYATVDRSKKTKRPAEVESSFQVDPTPEAVPPEADTELSPETTTNNYENVGPEAAEKSHTDAPNYANIDFAQSLELYENSRDVIRSALTRCDLSKLAAQIGRDATGSTAGSTTCNKCGHACEPHVASAVQVVSKDADDVKHSDYMMMDPTQADQGNVLVKRRDVLFPGYLPMSPITDAQAKSEAVKMCLNRVQGLPSEKSASIPSLLGPFLDRGKKRIDSEFVRVPGSAMLMMNHNSASNSPYLKRMSDAKEESRKFHIARRRSNSADSSRYLEDLESVSSSPVSTHSRVSSVNSLLSQCECAPAEEDRLAEPTDSDPVQASESGSSSSIQTLVQASDASPTPSSSAVHIRRSSSVPCKSGTNRDSSSSNDSGVSIGSLRHRGSDLTDFELPLTTALSSTWRQQRLGGQGSGGGVGSKSLSGCVHASLERRSKSSDPLKEITFQFLKMNIQPKSSSAEAEVPLCPSKKEGIKGPGSPGSESAIPVPYMDCTSTSSGTSDMSDYIETLSLSSHSSSDNPDCLRLNPTTTLRPRSGKEYQKIDRSLLDRDLKSVHSVMGPVLEKNERESPSPGYQSMTASP